MMSLALNECNGCTVLQTNSYLGERMEYGIRKSKQDKYDSRDAEWVNSICIPYRSGTSAAFRKVLVMYGARTFF